MNAKNLITCAMGDGLHSQFVTHCKKMGVTPSQAIRNAIILYAQNEWGIVLVDDTRKRGERGERGR